LKSLKAYLHTLFQKKLAPMEIDAIIEVAAKRKLFQVTDLKVSYP
jgi:hypothetical protein